MKIRFGAGVALAVLAVEGCGDRYAGPAGQTVPVPPAATAGAPVDYRTPANPAPSGSDPGAAASPPFAMPRTSAMPSAPLALRAASWTAKSLPTPRRIGHGGVVLPGIGSPDRVALATAGRKGALHDVRTGDVLAKLPAPPAYVSGRAGVVTLEGSPPRLLRLRDAQVITPRLEASGWSLESVSLAASPERARPIALGIAKGGAKLVGLPTAELDSFAFQPAPFETTTERYQAVLNVFGGYHLVASADRFAMAGTPFTMKHEPGCIRAELADDGALRCLEHPPATSTPQVRWMQDGWLSTPTAISHIAWKGRLLDVAGLVGSSGCFARSTRDAPPRVLFRCEGAQSVVWTPSAIFTFPTPRAPNGTGGVVGADSGPVIPVVDDQSKEPRESQRYVDLVALRHWTTPTLSPLRIAAFAGVGLRTLAEAPGDGRAREVYVLDFQSGTRELAARITDCPGGLGELWDGKGASDRWLVLACMTPEQKHTVARTLVWAEILDTERRVRMRTPLLPEIVFDDGLVVLSARRALSAETKAAHSDVFSVDVAAP